MIAASPTLQAREQRALAGYADALAAELAAETGAPADDIRARVAANALMGVQCMLIDYVRKRVLAMAGGRPLPKMTLSPRSLASTGERDEAARRLRRRRRGLLPSPAAFADRS